MILDKFLEANEIETDELGRIIVKDLNFLKKINGAIGGNQEFMIPDVACGNTNCVC